MKVFPYIGHDDHPITSEQLEFIQTHPELITLEEGTFVCKVLSLPEYLGTIPSALYGPDAGDEPITEEQVVWLKRSDRDQSSRCIELPDRPAKNVCVIGIIGKTAFTIYGTQSKTPAPREPWDDSIETTEEAAHSFQWWSEHALSTSSWKN